MGGFYEGGYRQHAPTIVTLHRRGRNEVQVLMPDGALKTLGHADMSYGSWFQLEQAEVGAQVDILVRQS